MHPTFLLSSSGVNGLLSSLGVNGPVLLLDAAAFLVVVWVMGRFVYPPLIKALDARLAEMDATSRARQAAEAQLSQAQQTAAGIVTKARAGADDILADARTEAAELLQTAAAKAEAQAQRIVDGAHEQLARNVATARHQLRTETARLVAAATEVVLDEKLTDERDIALIARAVDSHAAGSPKEAAQ